MLSIVGRATLSVLASQHNNGSLVISLRIILIRSNEYASLFCRVSESGIPLNRP